jgi:formate-dependent nitrite reductase membrane component NrfD
MQFIPIMGMITGIITTLGFFLAVVFTVKYVTAAKNKEKMALIEKGVDISEIYQKKDHRNVTLKIGMFLVGIAIGLFAGYLLAAVTSINDVVAYFSMILLFGGASLIVFHWYNSRLPD